MVTRTNKDPFIALINEHEPLIRKVSRVYGLSGDERKDIFQNIVLQLWKAYSGFRQESKPSTWIYRVALNTAISYSRKERRRINPDIPLPDIAAPADEGMQEQVSLLHAMIARLGKMDKALIFLHLEGYRYSEIAELSGLAETNVSTKISRIKKQLAEKIEKINPK